MKQEEKKSGTVNNTSRDNVSLRQKAGNAALSAASSASNLIKGSINDTGVSGESELGSAVGDNMSGAGRRAMSAGKAGINKGAEVGNKIKDRLKNKQGAAKKAAKGPANAAKKAKEGADKAKKVVAAIKTVLLAIKALVLALLSSLLPLLISIAVAVAIAVVAGWLDKLNSDIQQGIDQRQEKTTVVGNLSSEVSKTWVSLFYQRFSDAMFYAQVEHPDSGDIDTETEITFSEITGFSLDEIDESVLYQGDSEFLRTHNIHDFENHESQLVLSWVALQQLDDKLNSPYIYPEQFIKPLYASCTKDGFEAYYDEGHKLEECKLLDDAGELYLLTAESTNYSGSDSDTEDEKQARLHSSTSADTEWTKGDGKIRGNWDWGLGSIIKYKTFYQSSKVENMKVAKLIGWDDSIHGLREYINPTSADYDKYLNFEFYIPNETITYKDHMEAIKQATTDGDNSPNLLGEAGKWVVDHLPFWRTPTDESGQRINPIYKDDIDKVGDFKEWWRDEPGLTTSIPDPKIVYGIKYALTPFGAMNIDLRQEWTEIAETEATQFFPYVAIVNDHPNIGPEDPVPDPCNGLCNAMIQVEGYKIISKNGTNTSQFDASSRLPDDLRGVLGQSDKAYDASTGFWYNPETMTKQTTNDSGSYYTGRSETRCPDGSYPTSLPDGAEVCSDGSLPEYIPINETYACVSGNSCNGFSEGSTEWDKCGCQTWKQGYYKEGETNPANVYEGAASDYTFGAIYKMTLKAVKKGSLMTNLVYYGDEQPEPTDNVGVDYLREYIDNYQAMIPSENNSSRFACYQKNGNPTTNESGFYTLDSLKGVNPNWSQVDNSNIVGDYQ